MSAVPHSNHHTVWAATWQNHDSSPPQSVFILHSNVCLGLSNLYISSALWRQRASENTAHYIPSCSEAWVKQWLQMTGALFIAYDALRMNIEFSATPKHPLVYCSTYFQAHSHPITSFSFQPQHYFYWVSLFIT